MENLTLSGHDLNAEALEHVALGHPKITLSDAGLARMTDSRGLVDKAIADGIAVYGVTTGLGSRSGDALEAVALSAFSYQTLQGRAQDIGPPMPPHFVRAAMIVRLNTLLLGHSGARPEVAHHIREVLQAGLVPMVGSVGSIGAGDLVLNAAIGRCLMGEGQMQALDGVGPSDDKMRAAGIAALDPAPRDGLALANHTGVSTAGAALKLAKATRLYEATQAAAGLSLEAFRANLGPIEPRVLAVKPLPGQDAAAKQLRALLDGSALWHPGAARRLQDPLSFRNVVQIHGGLDTALRNLRTIVDIELNGSSDNPVALVETDEILSCGGYHTTELALAVEGVCRAWQHVAMAQVARIARLMEPDLTDLPLFLARQESGSNGFAPLLKVVEDLAADITRAAQPTPVWPSINARGIEDALTAAPSAIRALAQIMGHAARLTAIELTIAAQGIDLRKDLLTLGPAMQRWHARTRARVAGLDHDRPMGAEIEALAQDLLVYRDDKSAGLP